MIYYIMSINNKSFAIVTAVLNEQDYINYFIECYLGVGFHKFYVLLDDSQGEQLPYTLKEHFKPRVQFIRLSEIFNKDAINYRLKAYEHKSGLIHEALQVVYRTRVKEDYCMLVGIDSLLYLNERTIQQYFIEKNIGDNIGLVFFHWFVAMNSKLIESQYNLVNYINSDRCFKAGSDHFFTLCNKKHVVGPTHDSHHYILNHDVLGFYNDNVYTIKPSYSFWTISRDILKVNSTDVRPHPCILHFVIRSVNDAIIKYYYQWSKNDPAVIEHRRRVINYIILSGSKDPAHYEGRLAYILRNNTFPNDLKIQTNYETIYIMGNDALIRQVLHESGVPYDKYIEWALNSGYFS